MTIPTRCNFVGDTTSFGCNQTLTTVLEARKGNLDIVIFWFENNYMNLNTDICNFLISGSNTSNMTVKIMFAVNFHTQKFNITALPNFFVTCFCYEKNWQSSDVKLLGVEIESKHNFDSHIASIFLKANEKVRVLGRFSKLLSYYLLIKTTIF